MTQRTRIRRRSLRAVVLAAFAAAALPAGDALAEAGDLDPSFGTAGRATLAADGHPEATLVQPDGRIVVVSSSPADDLVVRRLLADGRPDLSFDGDGQAVADLGGTEYAHAAALQPDGGIVVAGTSLQGGIERAAVARFSAGGKLDASFSPGGAEGDGRAILEGMSTVFGVHVQPDGRIVAAGHAAGNWRVARLTRAGAPDGTEYQPVRFDSGAAVILAVAALPDGRLAVAGGNTPTTTPWRGAVAVYEENGALDPGFGEQGRLLLEAGEFASADAVLARKGGGLLVAGATDAADRRVRVIALDHAGRRDPGFGEGGLATVDFAGPDFLGGAMRLPDGRVVLAGHAGLGDVATATRLTAGGDPDPSFGTAGRVAFPFGVRTITWSAALQPDGALLLGVQTYPSATVARTGVARLLGDPAPQPVTGGGDPTPEPVTGGGGDAPPAAVQCGGRPATLVGTAAAETLRGTSGADVIVARGGRDRVIGAGGADRICGGGGRDVLRGGADRDRLDGGTARDRCLGGAGRDRTRRCER